MWRRCRAKAGRKVPAECRGLGGPRSGPGVRAGWSASVSQTTRLLHRRWRGRVTSKQASRLRHTRAPCGEVEGRRRSVRCQRSAAGSEARAPVPTCPLGGARVCRRPLACWSAQRERITSKQASRLRHTRAPCGEVAGRRRGVRCLRSAAGRALLTDPQTRRGTSPGGGRCAARLRSRADRPPPDNR